LGGEAQETGAGVPSQWLIASAASVNLGSAALEGLLAAESAAAIASVLGLLFTIFTLPETKGKSLESCLPSVQRRWSRRLHKCLFA